MFAFIQPVFTVMTSKCTGRLTDLFQITSLVFRKQTFLGNYHCKMSLTETVMLALGQINTHVKRIRILCMAVQIAFR